MFEALIAIAAVLSGAVASIAGFGIGSILTPILAVQAGARLAVAAVSIPHLLATLLRFWLLRRDVNRRMLIDFGAWSAAGGLIGAALHSYASNPALSVVLAVLLIFAGVSGVTGRSETLRFGRRVAWLAGAVSGLLGGLVGNQGGIRSAALLGFDLDREAFVATATGIGLVVDAVRMPFYVATAGAELERLWLPISVACAGALFGTVFGRPILARVPARVFSRLVGALLIGLGAFMLLEAGLRRRF